MYKQIIAGIGLVLAFALGLLVGNRPGGVSTAAQKLGLVSYTAYRPEVSDLCLPPHLHVSCSVIWGDETVTARIEVWCRDPCFHA